MVIIQLHEEATVKLGYVEFNWDDKLDPVWEKYDWKMLQIKWSDEFIMQQSDSSLPDLSKVYSVFQ